MAMPPYFEGSAHPLPMQPSMFPAPLIPPGISSKNLYQGHPPVYVNPYMQQHSSNMMSHHSHLQSYPYGGMHNAISFPSSNNFVAGTTSMPILPHAVQQNQQYHQEYGSNLGIRRQPYNVDKEILEEMTGIHLGYLETEDSPHKMEQREKLEQIIMEYLSITPHSNKFMFEQVNNILENSINAKSNFNAHNAACAFDALAQYAANLISQPWRKEFREIKLYNGFWVHQVSSHLSGAESVLELIGYNMIGPKKAFPKGTSSKHNMQNSYVHEGILDPDLISRLALDCIIAFCELQCLNKIKEGVSEFGLSWPQVLQFRELYIGGIEVTTRQLLFNLRQRLGPTSLEIPNAPELSPVSSGHPQMNDYNCPQVTSSYNKKYPLEPLGSSIAPPSTSAHNNKSSGYHYNSTAPANEYQREEIVSPHSCQSDSATLVPSRKNRIHHNEEVTPSPTLRNSSSSYGSNGSNKMSAKGASSSRVPTAKLIDLDSIHESSSPNVRSKSSSMYLPKVLPHKTSSSTLNYKNSHHHGLPNEGLESPPLEPSSESFQEGTLEEHLAATLNLVKNPTARNTPQDKMSLESWDFVYRGLEKKGYTKDIGDRGDILHTMNRHKNNGEVPSSSRKNGTLNEFKANTNFNTMKSGAESKNLQPLTINQALEQLTQHENKERMDSKNHYKTPSSKSCHSIGHAYGHDNHKRSSLYDNLSGGFETAMQGSDDYEDRKPQVNLKKNNNRLIDNMSSRSSDSYSRSAELHTAVADIGGGQDSVDDNGENNSPSWSCKTCTFLNGVGISVCEMCGKSREPDTKPLVSGGKQCPLCTLINDKNVQDCSACGADLKGSSTYI